jgi:hypothetical protein
MHMDIAEARRLARWVAPAAGAPESSHVRRRLCAVASRPSRNRACPSKQSSSLPEWPAVRTPQDTLHHVDSVYAGAVVQSFVAAGANGRLAREGSPSGQSRLQPRAVDVDGSKYTTTTHGRGRGVLDLSDRTRAPCRGSDQRRRAVIMARIMPGGRTEGGLCMASRCTRSLARCARARARAPGQHSAAPLEAAAPPAMRRMFLEAAADPGGHTVHVRLGRARHVALSAAAGVFAGGREAARCSTQRRLQLRSRGPFRGAGSFHRRDALSQEPETVLLSRPTLPVRITHQISLTTPCRNARQAHHDC